jgi:hypothetical protein
MCDHHQCLGAPEDALQALSHIVRVKCREALVKQNGISALEQSPRKKDAAALTLRELPSCFTHHLLETTGHTLQELA